MELSLAPAVDFNLLEPGHVVQFYEEEQSLLNAVTAFIGGGLRAGERCLVVATPAHRQALQSVLSAGGVNLRDASERGDYVELDAAATLSRFMKDGAPDAERFAQSVGALVERLSEGRRLRIFGEMVALLQERGEAPAAIRLEELWNELGSRRSFLLLCAYPIAQFRGSEHSVAFAHVCRQHGHVVPAESYSARPAAEDRLAMIAQLQQKALSLESEVAVRRRVEEELRRREQELAEKVAELSDKIQDLEVFHDVAVNREMKMMELQRELETLKEELRQLKRSVPQTSATPGGRSISSIS